MRPEAAWWREHLLAVGEGERERRNGKDEWREEQQRKGGRRKGGREKMMKNEEGGIRGKREV